MAHLYMDDGGSYQYYKRKPQPDYSEERYEINIPTKPAAPEKENSSGGGGGYTGGGSGSKLSGVDRDVYDRLESSFSRYRRRFAKISSPGMALSQ